MHKNIDEEAVPEDSQPLVPVKVPYFDAASVTIHATGNNFVLLFSRPLPVEPRSGSDKQIMLNDPVVILSFSPQSIKDLSLLLNGVIADHEQAYGTLITPYMKKLEAEGQ